MAHPTGESESDALRLDFDRRLRLKSHGSDVTSDAGLLPFREPDDSLGLTEMAGAVLSDGRRGKNTRHVLCGLLRLAGYDDVNDADRLARDPAMRATEQIQAPLSAPMPLSQTRRSTSFWRQSISSTRSGCLPIRFSKRGSRICSHDQLVAVPTRSDDITPASGAE